MVTNLYFHMAKLADVTEAPLLLPQVAHRLATHGSFAVSKRTVVTLKRQIAGQNIFKNIYILNKSYNNLINFKQENF